MQSHALIGETSWKWAALFSFQWRKINKKIKVVFFLHTQRRKRNEFLLCFICFHCHICVNLIFVGNKTVIVFFFLFRFALYSLSWTGIISTSCVSTNSLEQFIHKCSPINFLWSGVCAALTAKKESKNPVIIKQAAHVQTKFTKYHDSFTSRTMHWWKSWRYEALVWIKPNVRMNLVLKKFFFLVLFNCFSLLNFYCLHSSLLFCFNFNILKIEISHLPQNCFFSLLFDYYIATCNAFNQLFFLQDFTRSNLSRTLFRRVYRLTVRGWLTVMNLQGMQLTNEADIR